MSRRTILSLVCLARMATARQCQNLTVGLEISSRNGVFNLETPQTNLDAIDFVLNVAKQDTNYTNDILSHYTTVSGVYKVAATYCEPDDGPSSILQILTHGVGFDRGYWDFPANNYNYSYTRAAVDDHGYSTFTYDRLGLGGSSRGDPLDHIQSWLELAALQSLTQKLRANDVPQLRNKTFEKLVHVGHSFGSILTYSLAALNTSASDGIVLTGFSHNATFMPYFLLGGAFVQANTLRGLGCSANGTLAPAVVSAAQTNFFAPGVFDPIVLQAAYDGGQPVTVGELLTLGAASGVSSSFAGPVLIITGDRDLPFCGGDCSATGDPALDSILDQSKELLQLATPIETYVVPGAGHGLALEYTHVETEDKIFDFLESNDLGGTGNRYGTETW